MLLVGWGANIFEGFYVEPSMHCYGNDNTLKKKKKNTLFTGQLRTP